MTALSIDPELRSVVPDVAVGCITARVRVTEHDEDLWRDIQLVVDRYAGLSMEDARRLGPIQAMREAYRALGNDPTRYRGSSEALIRRIVQGKGLYRVNTIVDINNLISLETLHSAGTFDLDRIQLPVMFRAGRAGESYSGIGRGEINLAGIPVFADVVGPFGSTTSDSQRTMVQLHTTRIMMVVISFMGGETLEAPVRRAMGLLETYAAVTEIETCLRR